MPSMSWPLRIRQCLVLCPQRMRRPPTCVAAAHIPSLVPRCHALVAHFSLHVSQALVRPPSSHNEPSSPLQHLRTLRRPDGCTCSAQMLATMTASVGFGLLQLEVRACARPRVLPSLLPFSFLLPSRSCLKAVWSGVRCSQKHTAPHDLACTIYPSHPRTSSPPFCSAKPCRAPVAVPCTPRGPGPADTIQDGGGGQGGGAAHGLGRHTSPGPCKLQAQRHLNAPATDRL
jgi:hypothetical protein